MSRTNHYERAFEHFLRCRDIPHFANRQEFRNPLEEGESLKNFDFIVSGCSDCNWIIDLKGRRFPGGQSSRRYWKNWITGEDMSGLLQWERQLGTNFHGLLVFAYLIEGNRAPLPEKDLFLWRERCYAFIAVELHDYISEARMISPRWQTFELPAKRFRAMGRSFEIFLRKGKKQNPQFFPPAVFEHS